MKNMKAKSSELRLYLTFLVCTAVVTLALIPINIFGIPKLKVGQRSSVNVKSPYSLKVEDTVATQEKREEAVKSVKPVLKIDRSAVDQIMLEINEDALKRENVKTGFIFELLKRYYSVGVIPDSISGISKRVTLVDTLSGTSTERDISSFYTLSRLRKKLRTELTALLGRERGARVFSAISSHLRTNVFYDREETRKLRERAISSVKPIFYEVRKGEIVVRKGEKVTRKQAEILKAIRGFEEKERKPEKYISILLLTAATFLIVYKLIKLVSPTASSKENTAVFSFTVITIDILLIKLLSYLAGLMLESMNIPLTPDLVYIPIFTSTILASMFITKKVATVHTIPISVIPSLMMPKPELFIVPILLGTVFSCFDSRKYRSRNVIYKSAFLAGTGIASIQLIMIFGMYGLRLSPELLLVPLSFIGALISGIVVNGLLPVLGSIFNFTTDIVYMELINLNHPLLRKLILKAPGTYNHSVMVSTLAEAAAEAIGANSLLAKAGGLYHDIGKLKNPQAFVENQSGVNIHEKLTPERSASILRSHIEYGEELAKRYKLPKPIVDIIRQHHGTKVMEYFFNKALESGEKVEERTFRYPGPKPQFKEAGIVMLADTVEAAVRSMRNRKVNIPDFIHRLIMKDVEDGQLNQSGLSLKEIATIEKVFDKILTGTYHERIEYPESVKEGD